MRNASLHKAIIGIILLGVVAGGLLFDRVLGVRLSGVVLMGMGAWAINSRRIPYGIESEPPAGYITGKWAVIIGATAIIVGIAILWRPTEFAESM